ncbi:uncharacterized protein LOC101858336, partial [Aplysia californica]|uniref:Uncharacterized protein LOC101858336 n=1 Tax=Aplysia californica TaxID=6500 RepID=A0ABM0JKQ6_APLCA
MGGNSGKIDENSACGTEDKMSRTNQAVRQMHKQTTIQETTTDPTHRWRKRRRKKKASHDPTWTPDQSHDSTWTPDQSHDPTWTPDLSHDPTWTPDQSHDPTWTPEQADLDNSNHTQNRQKLRAARKRTRPLAKLPPIAGLTKRPKVTDQTGIALPPLKIAAF